MSKNWYIFSIKLILLLFTVIYFSLVSIESSDFKFFDEISYRKIRSLSMTKEFEIYKKRLKSASYGSYNNAVKGLTNLIKKGTLIGNLEKKVVSTLINELKTKSVWRRKTLLINLEKITSEINKKDLSLRKNIATAIVNYLQREENDSFNIENISHSLKTLSELLPQLPKSTRQDISNFSMVEKVFELFISKPDKFEDADLGNLSMIFKTLSKPEKNRIISQQFYSLTKEDEELNIPFSFVRVSTKVKKNLKNRVKMLSQFISQIENKRLRLGYTIKLMEYFNYLKDSSLGGSVLSNLTVSYDPVPQVYITLRGIEEHYKKYEENVITKFGAANAVNRAYSKKYMEEVFKKVIPSLDEEALIIIGKRLQHEIIDGPKHTNLVEKISSLFKNSQKKMEVLNLNFYPEISLSLLKEVVINIKDRQKQREFSNTIINNLLNSNLEVRKTVMQKMVETIPELENNIELKSELLGKLAEKSGNLEKKFINWTIDIINENINSVSEESKNFIGINLSLSLATYGGDLETTQRQQILDIISMIEDREVKESLKITLSNITKLSRKNIEDLLE